MKRWLIENMLGFSSTFLERNMRQTQSHRARQEMPVSECSSIMIRGIVPLEASFYNISRMCIRGYQKHRDYHIPISFEENVFLERDVLLVKNPLKTRLRIFSCHNEIVLYIFLISGKLVKYYYTTFSPCRLLQGRDVSIREFTICNPGCFLDVKETPSYKLDVKVFSLKDLHENWEDSVDVRAKKRIICNLGGVEYMLEDLMCVFCFKKHKDEDRMVQHIKNIHVYYEATLQCLETQADISVSGHSFSKKCLNIVERKISSTQEPYAEFFFCRKRRKGSSIEHNFPYTYFEPETLEPLGTKRVGFPWETFLIRKQFEEIIDLPESQIKIIAEWTIFMRNKKVRPYEGNIFGYVKEFVDVYEPSFDIFMFITCLYNNAVLSLEEVYYIIAERVL